MLSMQYKIQLPDDFDMNLIRQRVRVSMAMEKSGSES